MVKFSNFFPILLLCPTLYGMQQPEGIDQKRMVFSIEDECIERRLEEAAKTHDIKAYHKAASDAIRYAYAFPDDLENFLMGADLKTLTSDLIVHHLSIGYGIAMDDPAHATSNTTNAHAKEQDAIIISEINKLIEKLKEIQRNAPQEESDSESDSWSDLFETNSDEKLVSSPSEKPTTT